MKQIVLAITGASGAPYARRLAQCLAGYDDVHLHLIVSPYGQRILADEVGIKRLSIDSIVGRPAANATLYSHKDAGARLASGSFQTHGMVVCPCSSNTLGAIAAGVADNLVTRAAMVTMKESRRLILVPREMPLSPVELEGMLKLARYGVVICPACPGFYMNPTSIDELVDFVVGRILDLLGLSHALRTRWLPMTSDNEAAAE